jgi:2',3'-cyclic-nucleotide 2'-phosphodiesterase (5'-nucleotidase family)
LLLANEVEGIDIVLGGHDHHYQCEKVCLKNADRTFDDVYFNLLKLFKKKINEKWVIKSGTGL